MATILVIDDEPTNRQLLSTILGYRGHRVIEIGDGQEGLEKSCAEKPDLAIVDILMPTMDGFEFVRQLRANPAIAKTPVIFYTAAYYEREIRSLARDCGVSHILIKPAEPQVIIDTVDAVLGIADVPRESPPPQQFDREHLRVTTDKLSQKVAELETVTLRLGRPGALELEITESVIMEDMEHNIQILQTIKALGVDIVIDDFGTGYSSLSYLAKLPVTTLKIDRSFIFDLEKNPKSLSIVTATISLAHSLNLKVIAEGVETQQQLELLQALQCDEIQGFLFSPAVPPAEVEKFLRD